MVLLPLTTPLANLVYVKRRIIFCVIPKKPQKHRQDNILLQYIDKYTYTEHIYQLHIYTNGFMYYIICSVSRC